MIGSPNSQFDMFPQEMSFDDDASGYRVQRLEDLLQLRKIYRNCLRAEYLLRLETPIYEEIKEQSNLSLYSGEEREEIEKQVLNRTLETIAEMQVTSDQLKVCEIGEQLMKCEAWLSRRDGGSCHPIFRCSSRRKWQRMSRCRLRIRSIGMPSCCRIV